MTIAPFPSGVAAGAALPYAIRIANVGDRPLRGVTLIHLLVGDASVVSSWATRGVCRGAPVTCDLGDLARGQVETVSMVAATRAEGRLTVRATVASREPPASAVTSAATAVLGPPTAFTVVRDRPHLELRWSHSGRAVSGFEIERKETGAFRRVGLASPSARTFVDRTARPGRAYVYRMRAVAGTAASDVSTEVIATLAPMARR